MFSRRAPVLLLSAVLALAVLGASTQEWIRVALVSGSDHSVTGSQAAAAISPLSLAVVASVAAGSLARRRGLIVLAIVQALLGIGLTVTTVSIIADPVSASAAQISAATGVAGSVAITTLVDSTQLMGWPFAAAAAAVLVVGAAGIVLVRSGAWARRRAGRMGADSAPEDPAGQWDMLSRGGDPTQDV